MHAVTSPGAVWASAGAVVLALGLLSSMPPALHAQPATQGQWRTLTNQAPINPIHVALMNTGEVLIVSGSGNLATETVFQAAVWDPISQTFQTQTHRLGHVLQWHGGPARRTGVRQRRQSPVRPVLR